MASIADGIGPRFTPAEAHGWRDSAPSTPVRRGWVSQTPGGPSAGEIGRFGAFGSLYEARGREWAEAVQVRQLDRRLGKLSERVTALRDVLEQVKFYPPYPVNE